VEGSLTRVRSEVLPEPLGPMSRMEGSVVKPLARKTKEWRKMGINRVIITVIARTNGEGLKRASTQLETILLLILQPFYLSVTQMPFAARLRSKMAIRLYSTRVHPACKRSRTGVTAQLGSASLRPRKQHIYFPISFCKASTTASLNMNISLRE
jgi:hypothetical protein